MITNTKSQSTSDGELIGLVGGAGFIGTRLGKRLLDSGYKVRIVDKVKGQWPDELYVHGDVTDVCCLRTALTGCDTIYNLAAEHRDDVDPPSLYWDVNVKGADNICSIAQELGINRVIFVSSVAVYGLGKAVKDEGTPPRPFNEYGRSKLCAEQVHIRWQQADPTRRSLAIVRPTVVFGEGNRGNVYNLLKLIATGRFIMVGDGKNKKSMAYVENVAAFLEFVLRLGPGLHLFNYADKPDMEMAQLVNLVRQELGINGRPILRIPYVVGYMGGLALDLISRASGRKLPISSIRIRKFCSQTKFDSAKVSAIGFKPPYTLIDGLRRTIHFDFQSHVRH